MVKVLPNGVNIQEATPSYTNVSFDAHRLYNAPPGQLIAQITTNKVLFLSIIIMD